MAAQLPNAKIDNAAASGNLTVVAAKTGYKIRLIAFYLIAGGTVTCQWTDGAGGTALSGPLSLTSTCGLVDAQSPGLGPAGYQGWFETSAGNALVLNCAQAIQVGGGILYQYITAG